MLAPAPVSPGDLYGFAALIVIGAAAFFMLIRSVLLKRTRNLNLLRSIHLALSISAGAFLILHITYLFAFPTNPGIDLGYVSFAVGLIVWASGTAFLERLRDSLFFHGTLASLLVSLALIHAALASPNISFELAQVILAVSSSILIANALYHLRKGVAGR